MKNNRSNSLGAKKSLMCHEESYVCYSLERAGQAIGADFSRLPFSLKILVENLLRFEDGNTVSVEHIDAFSVWLRGKKVQQDIAFRPSRVLMQDFTGVPAVVDLAAMRDAMVSLGGDPQKVNPLIPVDLVIDHSVQVDRYGDSKAFAANVAMEMQRNQERYALLRSAAVMFENFRVVPPGTGICHQVNLEYLAKVVCSRQVGDDVLLYPDSCVGTDSHTTMINGLSVLGWGVGGIEAEAAMLGQPISMNIPEVVGFKLTGALQEGTTATDIVLTVTEILRQKGVVGKFVEFYGPGLDHLPLADRATIANMAPEYGATCGIFPIDDETIKYLKLSARDMKQVALVECYAKEQGLWRQKNTDNIVFSETVALDLATVEPSLAGPKRPQDRVALSRVKKSFEQILADPKENNASSGEKRFSLPGKDYDIGNGDVVIAAITSCTNTSNPAVMLAAGLVAKKAVQQGITVKPWVKTSLAPGSKVVSGYLSATGLQDYLDRLGFHLVGYGCTTCIGNSGPLEEAIESVVKEQKLIVASVLSGNRNFEGRVHPLTRTNYLASPPLVVAYAIAGSMNIDVVKDPLAFNAQGEPVYLKDLWPSNTEIRALVAQAVTPEMFRERYRDIFSGDENWQKISTSDSLTYQWDTESTYIKKPPYFTEMKKEPVPLEDIHEARVLALFGDSITTDHISPAGTITAGTPAALFLESKGVDKEHFNSYGSRRGNDEVMVRGTFANIRIRNAMAPDKEGGYTTHIPSGKVMSIYDAAMRYQKDHTPLVIFAGKDYGMGSSRDWAAKGTVLLGVKAVIAESFERIHRSNLIGMGVLPLVFQEGVTWEKLAIDGSETLTINGLSGDIKPKMDVSAVLKRHDGSSESLVLRCGIHTSDEAHYLHHGGILQKVLRDFLV